MQLALASGRTQYEMLSMDFVSDFKEKLKQLTEVSLNGPVKASFFESKDGKLGFLEDLKGCLQDQGFSRVANSLPLKLNDDKTLPVKSMTQGIIHANRYDLNKLRTFHSDMENVSDGDGLFSGGYKKIGKYFSTAEKASHNSAIAGRVVMLLGSLSYSVTDLLDCFQKHVPFTVDRFQDILDRVDRGEFNRKIAEKLDGMKKGIDILLSNLKSTFVIREMETILRTLKKQKKNALKIIISRARKIRELVGDKFNLAKMNLHSWVEWEKLSESEKESDEAFGEELMKFKEQLHDDLGHYNQLSQGIQKSLGRKEPISTYFKSVINDGCEVADKIMSSKVTIEPKLKDSLRKSTAHWNITRVGLEKAHKQESVALEKFPELIRRRLQYLNEEIPRTLTRANPKEIKYMTLVINASYKNIERSVERFFESKDSPEHKAEVVKFLRKRFTDVIRSSTKMVRS